MDAAEDLLQRLMARLDENDRRYGDALGELNQRLDQLSQRVQSAGNTHSTSASKALDRVHEQASSLAEQVNEAGAAHRAQQELGQRLGEFAGAGDEALNANLGDSRLNDDFSEVTRRLEHSLSARAPANDLGTLSSRMDDLSGRLDAALTSGNNPEALRTIESQLSVLTSGFQEAQQNYARVEAIESNLIELMKWAQSAAGANLGSESSRLDAIEQTLRVLDENAREMDARTVGTLEAMNESLHALAANIGTPGADVYSDDTYIAVDDEEPGQAVSSHPEPDEYAEVIIQEGPEPDHPQSGPSAGVEKLGATIPDYQPAPDKTARRSAPAPADRGMAQERIEPGFDDDNEFIASARRAAAAAASQEPASKPAESPRRVKKMLPGTSLGAPGSKGKRSSPVLVVAVVALLISSAGLLYSRLRSHPHPPAVGTPQQSAPQPPEKAPKPAPTSESSPATPAPEAPAKTKKHSERMQNSISSPAESASPAQLEGPPPKPQTPGGQQAPEPTRGAALIKDGIPISTATVLASLQPDTDQTRMPDVTMSIEEPVTHAPASRARTASRAATPALVPPGETQSRPDPMPLPKRAPAPRPAQKPATAGPGTVDSAPADTGASGVNKLRTAMPPARIGPQSLRLAAARGNPAGQVEIASRYAKGTGVPKDLNKAAEWYQRAASQGHAPGQYRLAALYERGQGVKKDIGKARTWYRRAAELGNIRAMHNLAVLYTRNEGRGPDYMSARNWFHEAARHGLADSQFNLGILYERGLGVTRNAAEAYKWFTLAARQGDSEARKRGNALRRLLPARSLSAVNQTLRRWKPAPVNEAANRSGPPRGGWRNAAIEPVRSSENPALVTRAQRLLNKLGFDAGVPDGKLGAQTAAAIRRFETRSGKAGSGKVTPELLQQLEALGS